MDKKKKGTQKSREQKLISFWGNVMVTLAIASVIAGPWKPWLFLTALCLFMFCMGLGAYSIKLNGDEK